MSTATKPTTSEEMEAFATTTAEACQTHEQWLTFIRYGTKFLINENQPLFIELILREAVRMTEWAEQPPGYVPVDEARRIFDELGLRLTVAT